MWSKRSRSGNPCGEGSCEIEAENASWCIKMALTLIAKYLPKTPIAFNGITCTLVFGTRKVFSKNSLNQRALLSTTTIARQVRIRSML